MENKEVTGTNRDQDVKQPGLRCQTIVTEMSNNHDRDVKPGLKCQTKTMTEMSNRDQDVNTTENTGAEVRQTLTEMSTCNICIPSSMLFKGWWAEFPGITTPRVLVALYKNKPLSARRLVLAVGLKPSGQRYDRIETALDCLVKKELLKKYRWIRGSNKPITTEIVPRTTWLFPADAYFLTPIAARLAEIVHPQTYQQSRDFAMRELCELMGINYKEPGGAKRRLRKAVIEITTVFPLTMTEDGARGWKNQLTFSRSQEAKKEIKSDDSPVDPAVELQLVTLEKPVGTSKTEPQRAEKDIPVTLNTAEKQDDDVDKNNTTQEIFEEVAEKVKAAAKEKIEKQRKREDDASPERKPRQIRESDNSISLQELQERFSNTPIHVSSEPEIPLGIFPHYLKTFDELLERFPARWIDLVHPGSLEKITMQLRAKANVDGFAVVHAAVIYVSRNEKKAIAEGNENYPTAERLINAVNDRKGREELQSAKNAHDVNKQKIAEKIAQQDTERIKRKAKEKERENTKNQCAYWLKLDEKRPAENQEKLWKQAKEKAEPGARQFMVNMAYAEITIDEINAKSLNGDKLPESIKMDLAKILAEKQLVEDYCSE